MTGVFTMIKQSTQQSKVTLLCTEPTDVLFKQCIC